MKKIYMSFKDNIFYYIIYIMFIIEVIINIKSKYLWQDESFTIHIIQHNFIDIMKLTAQDVHPFLYYFIAKVFTYNIQNIFTKIIILRLVSALPYVIVLLISHVYIRKKFSKLSSQLFMFCIVSMPLLVDNICQVRMYGWATLFVVITYLLFIYAYKHNNLNTFCIISIFALLSAYTHYYALITVVVIYLLFLILFIIKKKNLIYLILSIMINVIFYLPWIGTLLNQTKNVSNNFWTSSIKLKDIIHMFIGNISPVNYKSIFYVFPMILIISLIILLFTKNISGTKLIGVLTPLIVMLIGYIFSIIMGHSIILNRYLTPSMGTFWLSLSLIIGNINVKNNKYKVIRYLLIFTIILTGTIIYVKNDIYTNKIANQFNSTLKIFNKINKNSAIIYNNPVIIRSSSIYLTNNYISKNSEKYLSFQIFNNVKINKDRNIFKHYENIYYIDEKYKTNNNKKIGEINLPLDGKSNIYKIK